MRTSFWLGTTVFTQPNLKMYAKLPQLPVAAKKTEVLLGFDQATCYPEFSLSFVLKAADATHVAPH